MPEPASRGHRLHLGSGHLTAAEILVLAPLAAFLVLWAIPDAFDVQWGCVPTSGVGRTSGDAYVAGFGVVGTLGWILVGLVVLFASITGWRRVSAALPIAWFTVLVLGALLVAFAIGPQVCA